EDPRVLLREPVRDLAGPVAAAIVDGEDAPVEARAGGQRRDGLGDGLGDQHLFVVGEKRDPEIRLLFGGHGSPRLDDARSPRLRPKAGKGQTAARAPSWLRNSKRLYCSGTRCAVGPVS